MQRSAWIFLSAILLPSLGLAWLAIHSVRDQQVVLQHQEAIICQNLTDALAKNIQDQMDHVRQDFVRATGQLLAASPSPEVLALKFNRDLPRAWPLAEIGFAVNLNGQIYSPQAQEGLAPRKFRDENDRFLSNRENAEVYFSNSLNTSNVATGFSTPSDNNTVNATPPPPAPSTVPDGGFRRNNSGSLPANLPGASPDQLIVSGQNAPVMPMEAQKHAKAKGAQASKTTAQDSPAKDASWDKMKALDADGVDTLAKEPVTAPSGSTVNAPTLPADTSDASTRLNAPPGEVSKSPLQGELSPNTASSDQTRALRAPSAAASPSAMPTTASAGASSNANLSGDQVEEVSTTPNAAQARVNSLPIVSKIQRKVIPQQQFKVAETETLSSTVPAESDFRQIIGNETSGALARFLENKLRLMVWSHTPVDSPIVFGAQLDQTRLIELLQTSFQSPDATSNSLPDQRTSNYCLAILDDSGHPVALSRTGFKADWKHPFVATELGEALPHWEAALYLIDPQQIDRTARTLQFTIALIVLVLVAAIVAGGSLIATDVRRQIRVAQQKTDFVSNVSHELKTPLTSIRMFADLLAEKRVPDEHKQATYLRIIAAEAARLTRLINNVLDFARLERGAPPGEHHACDLVDAVRDVIETCQPHLETSGVAFHSQIEAEKLPLVGDRDALAQIILNLVSNAEKYGGNDVTVRVRRQETPAGLLGCVDVLDRGQGISPRDMKTIFEPFHRLDDSLASGIPGSGLGLTLARRMARAHGGDVTCSARAGGGTCFTLSVPLTQSKS